MGVNVVCNVCDESHDEVFFFNLGGCLKGTSVQYVCGLYILLKLRVMFNHLIHSRIKCRNSNKYVRTFSHAKKHTHINTTQPNMHETRKANKQIQQQHIKVTS